MSDASPSPPNANATESRAHAPAKVGRTFWHWVWRITAVLTGAIIGLILALIAGLMTGLIEFLC